LFAYTWNTTQTANSRSTLLSSLQTTTKGFDLALPHYNPNLTTGGQWSDLCFPVLASYLEGKVSLESSTESSSATYVGNTSRHDLYDTKPSEWNFYFLYYKKLTRREKRRYKMAIKTQKEFTIEGILVQEIQRLAHIRSHFSKSCPTISYAIVPIQLVLKSLLLLCSFYNQPCRTYDGTTHPSNTLETSPSTVQVPVKVEATPTCSEGPQFVQVFLKLANEPNKPTMIKNGGTLNDLQLSISSLFPNLSPDDYFLSCGSKIITPSSIITFNDHAYRTIDINPRLRGGMMKSEDTPPEDLLANTLAAMAEQLKKLASQLEESNNRSIVMSKRIEILEERKVIDEEISDSDDGFHTPLRTKQPRLDISEVERTPFFKRSYSIHGSKEVKDTHSTHSSTTTTPTSPPTVSPTNRGFKPVTNADLKAYQVGSSWEEWHKRFLFIANSCCWTDGTRVATLCHFMPEDIKEFLQNLDPNAFKSCNTLSTHLESLFDLYEKTDEEREKEFLNITCYILY
jgi:hypothetical protein